MKFIKFPLGQVVITRGVYEHIKISEENVLHFLYKHATGDWGEICKEDRESNNYAVEHEERILSAYTLPKTKKKIWIITEWDRSVTTILFPDEY